MMIMAESKQHKVLVVAEGYNPTAGGFIDSLRGTLKQLTPPDGPTECQTFLTSVTRTKHLPDETAAEIDGLKINVIEPDWRLKPEPSRDLLTKYYRDYFSRQIVNIPGIQVIVGTEPYTALTASCLKDELAETYNINSNVSRSGSSRGSSSRSYSKSSTSKASSSRSGKSSSSSNNVYDDEPKFVMVNYMEGEGNDELYGLPGRSELELVENARDSDVVVSVGLRVYNYWRNVLYAENIVHEPYIPFEPILSQGRKVLGDANPKAIKRVLTLNTGWDILQSNFHQRVAGILGSLAQMKADHFETNFLTWIVQVDFEISDERKKEIKSTLAQWAKCKSLKIQLSSPETKSQLEHQVVISNLVLMPGMFHVSGYSGLECMMSSVPCLVPEDSDVGDVIRLEDSLDTAFLLPALGFAEHAENEWKRKIFNLLNNSADAFKHATDLRGKLEKSALYERSKKLLPQIVYGKMRENPPFRLSVTVFVLFFRKNKVKSIRQFITWLCCRDRRRQYLQYLCHSGQRRRM